MEALPLKNTGQTWQQCAHSIQGGGETVEPETISGDIFLRKTD
jgi:hypothetical protein